MAQVISSCIVCVILRLAGGRRHPRVNNSRALLLSGFEPGISSTRFRCMRCVSVLYDVWAHQIGDKRAVGAC